MLGRRKWRKKNLNDGLKATFKIAKTAILSDFVCQFSFNFRSNRWLLRLQVMHKMWNNTKIKTIFECYFYVPFVFSRTILKRMVPWKRWRREKKILYFISLRKQWHNETESTELFASDVVFSDRVPRRMHPQIHLL